MTGALVGWARYRPLLRNHRLIAALGASIVGRLHESMVTFGLILLVTQGGSYARAGLVLAAFGLGATAGAPVTARLADRLGHTRVLLVTAGGYAVAVVAMASTTDRLLLSAAMAAGAGLLTPPLTASLRSGLPHLVQGESRLTALALESTLQEIVFVAGPVLAGAAALAWGAQAALVVAAVTAAGGTVAYCLAVRGVVPDREDLAEGAAPLLTAEILRVLGGGIGFLAVLSVTAVALVAQVSGPTAQAGAGLLLGLTSVGSMVGGIWFGARVRAGAGPRSRFAVMAGILVGLAVVAATGAGTEGSAGVVLLGFAAFGYGTAIAPVGVVLFARLGELASRGRATEAFGWMGAAMGIGGAVGDAGGGWVVSTAGPAVAFVVAAAGAAVTALVVPGGADDA